MIRTSFLFALASFIYSANTSARQLPLKDSRNTNGNDKSHAISPIPFSVDVTFCQLTLQATEPNSLFMIVTGPDGVVLTQELQQRQGQTATFDLSAYQNGQYEIRIIDAKGNDVSGSFYKSTQGGAISVEEDD